MDAANPVNAGGLRAAGSSLSTLISVRFGASTRIRSGSALILTESLRTLDRARLRANLSDSEIARRRSTILAIVDSLELVEIDLVVLDRAAQPMPTELGTLDAIHLASALLWKDATGIEPVMATHDAALGLAAEAHGLKVLGT